jgi:hypothetical protein
MNIDDACKVADSCRAAVGRAPKVPGQFLPREQACVALADEYLRLRDIESAAAMLIADQKEFTGGSLPPNMWSLNNLLLRRPLPPGAMEEIRRYRP